MAALFFYVFVFVKLTLVSGQSVHYVLKGREAILSPALSKAPDDILWKHNGHKVITFDSAEERVFQPYEGRVTLGWGTAELAIADVRYEDSGEYELDVLFRERLSRSQYMLKVLDKVSKPVIRCEMNDESGNSTRLATLLCSSDSNTPEALTFKWNLEGKSHLGQTLNIALGNELDHIEYSCTASNPLHAESSVFTAKDCYTEDTSPALDVIVPIVIASLILLAFCIFPFIFRHQIKRACMKTGKTADLEKQTTVPDGNNKDEDTPLIGDIHRQETFPSKQRLLVQSDFEKETPQMQEATKELEELRPKRVKRRSKKFKNHTDSQPDTPTDEENDTDVGGMATPPPSSPTRNGQVDSEGEADLSHEELNVAPTSEGDSDASQYHDAPEQAEPVSQSLSSDPQDVEPGPGEHESRGQAGSEADVLLSEEHEGSPQTDEAADSSSVHSEQEEAPEHAVESQTNLGSSVPQEDKDSQITNKGLAESDEEFKPESPVDHGPQKDLTDEEPVIPQPDPAATLSHQPDSPPHPKAAELDLVSQSEPHEPERTEQADPDEKSALTPAEEDPQTDASHNTSVTPEPGATEESKVSNDSQMLPLPSELPGPQPGSESGLAPVQDSESEPEPEDKEKSVPETNAAPVDPQRESDQESETSDTKHEKTEDAALTDLQPSSPDSEPAAADSSSSQSDQDQNPDSGPDVEEAKGPEELDSRADEEPQKQDSSSEESEESKQTSATEITPTDDSELPGSAKESDESTHPPASALSQAARNKESKDTDAEDASSAQVSEETKDNTDKESDSSSSEQINRATESKAGRQQS